ncbi:unnamed protein product, partial [Ectocarpus fasciculatus]
ECHDKAVSKARCSTKQQRACVQNVPRLPSVEGAVRRGRGINERQGAARCCRSAQTPDTRTTQELPRHPSIHRLLQRTSTRRPRKFRHG